MMFSLVELMEAVASLKDVLDGRVRINSFSKNVAVVEYDSKVARISHFDEVIGEEPTEELYAMMRNYLTALKSTSNLTDSD